MAYTITQVPRESIIIVRILTPFNPQLDPIQIMHDIGKLINHITGTFYTIYDVRELTITFPEVVKGLASSFRSNIPELPVLRARGKMIIVGAGQLIELAAKSAQRLQPEQEGIKLFGTVEEAQAHAREQLAKAL